MESFFLFGSVGIPSSPFPTWIYNQSFHTTHLSSSFFWLKGYEDKTAISYLFRTLFADP